MPCWNEKKGVADLGASPAAAPSELASAQAEIVMPLRLEDGQARAGSGSYFVKASLADKRAPGLGKAGTGGVAFRLLRLVGRPQPAKPKVQSHLAESHRRKVALAFPSLPAISLSPSSSSSSSSSSLLLVVPRRASSSLVAVPWQSRSPPSPGSVAGSVAARAPPSSQSLPPPRHPHPRSTTSRPRRSAFAHSLTIRSCHPFSHPFDLAIDVAQKLARTRSASLIWRRQARVSHSPCSNWLLSARSEFNSASVPPTCAASRDDARVPSRHAQFISFGFISSLARSQCTRIQQSNGCARALARSAHRRRSTPSDPQRPHQPASHHHQLKLSSAHPIRSLSASATTAEQPLFGFPF
ncbi:hypothetical protein PaG_01154 [Moesziomyces aphidis]|uniref:Uncharacterized protein n=1 Tax=Moesziomyces aphidis TaxID=84754 RepID=W3VS43_MOEAP|nr:hypothetical protein PaG_01154 [Moesziomyces aphidis]